SVGVATVTPQPLLFTSQGVEPSRASAKASAERDSQQLFRQADDALYAAKAAGRDTVMACAAAVSEQAPPDLKPSPPTQRNA
ncbi:MAG: hypothetical protein WAT33_08470, partial [Giesbergeria sp.]